MFYEDYRLWRCFSREKRMVLPVWERRKVQGKWLMVEGNFGRSVEDQSCKRNFMGEPVGQVKRELQVFVKIRH